VRVKVTKRARAVLPVEFDQLGDDFTHLKRQWRAWAEWPEDVEIDDRVLTHILRMHRRLTNLVLKMHARRTPAE
jgi:hypothetical protein